MSAKEREEAAAKPRRRTDRPGRRAGKRRAESGATDGARYRRPNGGYEATTRRIGEE